MSTAPTAANGVHVQANATRRRGQSEDEVEEAPVVEEPRNASNKITPLPKLQLLIAIFIQVAEPVTCTVIYPFVNDLIREIGVTHGDEKKTGYYAGLVESIFYAAEALTVLHWGKASDIVGRKPILLGGMAGLALSMFGFGLSKRYWMLLASRCAQGAFNGNVGVTKSVMVEITDATNAPQAFAFLPVAWSVGSTIGPAIGGVFSKPAEVWPKVFGNVEFFKTFTYFLPCLIAALVPLLALVIGLIGLKETASSVLRKRRRQARSTNYSAAEASTESSSLLTPDVVDYGSTPTSQSTFDFARKPHDPDASCLSELEAKPTFGSVFIPQVLIPVTNFMFLAFLDQCLIVLIPLVYSTPVAYGGLDLTPSQIGVILGVFGLVNGFVQVFGFAWVRRTLGHRATYVSGIVGLGVAFAMFPVLEVLVSIEEAKGVDRSGGIAWGVWSGIVFQLACYSLSFMSYACMFLYVAAAAPTRSSLGTTNGLAQLSASGIRAIAPTTASSLFSLSLSLRNASGEGVMGRMGGYTVYVVLNLTTLAAVVWSRWLPKELN